MIQIEKNNLLKVLTHHRSITKHSLHKAKKKDVCIHSTKYSRGFVEIQYVKLLQEVARQFQFLAK
jgi:hypothetical protein